MISRVFWKLPAIRLSGFFLMLAAVSFLALSTVAYAEEIIYTGDKNKLQDVPNWLVRGPAPSVFPGTGAAPLSSGNKVTIDYTPGPGKADIEMVFGGINKLGNAANNEIILIRGQVNRGMSGGFSAAGDVSGNVVMISNGRVLSSVNGGTSRGGNAVNNTLTMSDGFVEVEACAGVSHNGNVAGNKVVINGGKINYFVCGGWSLEGNATDNAATISGGLVAGKAVGGRANSGNAAGNTFTISGGTVEKEVYGGMADQGDSTDNIVTIIDGSLNKGVFGGWNNNGDAANNIVTISGGVISDMVAGGFCKNSGRAVNNTVIISGGSTASNVYGGWGKSDATGNIITISGGSVEGDVLGGMSLNGNTTGNTVTISGRPDFAYAFILGGYTEDSGKDAFTGNTLNFKSSGISAMAIGYFEYCNFYLPEGFAADEVILGVKKVVYFAGTTVKVSLPDNTKLKKGDKIALIRSAEGTNGSPKNKSCQVEQGDTLYEFSIYTDKNNLWAKVTKISNAVK